MGEYSCFFAKLKMVVGVVFLVLWGIALVKSSEVVSYSLVLMALFLTAWLIISWVILSGVHNYGD